MTRNPTARRKNWSRCGSTARSSDQLERERILPEDERTRMHDEIEAEVADAVAYARAQPFPATHEAYEDLWA